jgi:hypothetical protein
VKGVVRADVVLGLKRGEMLGIRRKVWALKSEEHEHARLWQDLGFEVLEAIIETGGHCKSLLRATGGR